MADREPNIHPTALVSPEVELDQGVRLGPYVCIDGKVRIGKDTRIEAHVVISGRVIIGENNYFSPGSTIGLPPQDVSFKGEDTAVRIGDRNIIREFSTIHRGSPKGRGETCIGSDNYFMTYSHVGHDCQVGSHTTLTNGATLGGHVEVHDFANLSAHTGVHQHCKIGKYAFVGGYSVVTQDILPFSLMAGSRPLHLLGLNVVGLRRSGFSRERIRTLKEIYRIFFYSELNTSQALEKIQREIPPGEDRDEILRFVSESRRGIAKKPSESWEKDTV